MPHSRFEIWEENNTQFPLWTWRVQMLNYVARFTTRESAERFVAATKIYREKEGLK